MAYRTRPELGLELLKHLCKRCPERRIHAYADSTYGGQSVLAWLPANCDLTSRLPLDAPVRTASRAPSRHSRPTSQARSTSAFAATDA